MRPRLGIVGTGGWGKNHVRVFSELLGTERITACDVDPDRRAAIAKHHPGISTVERLDYATVDAVVIATPAPTHAPLAAEALAAGLDVLVEKPMTLAPRDALRLVELANEHHRILMVDHLLEYHPAVTALKSLLDQGDLGSLLHSTSDRLNLGVVRSAENAWWSLAPHDVSVMLYLFGEMPATVSAHGASFLQDKIEDVVTAIFRFPSGRMAQIRSSWLDPIKTRRVIIVGTEGMAVLDETAEQRLVVHDKRAVDDGGGWNVHRGEERSVPLDVTEPLRAMAEAFVDSIESRTPPRSDGMDGLRVVRVLEAAQRSITAGGAPMTIGDCL
ncbi:Gfo/Idh/MocA family oxidoreductase [Candidatus Bipolaricaulota bacterium]|nr:Gfo/Idh/MocA family oxidoreductase [Candidatus Bipolaricaulota bacterium]